MRQKRGGKGGGGGRSSSNCFVTSKPPTSVIHSALDLYSSGHVHVDFQREFDQRVFSPTSSDAPILDFEVNWSKTDVRGTVMDTRKT